MKEIPLTKGYVAIVDDADFDFLSQWKWHVNVGPKHVYAMRNSKPENGKRHHIIMHRVLCPADSSFDIDHINGNSLDNRRENLRVATRTQNMWNRSPNAKGKSKYKGVMWHKQHQKWLAAIQVNKKRYHIGLFLDEEEAGRAYAKRAAELFGEFNRETIK